VSTESIFALNSTLDFLGSWFGRQGLYSDGTPLKVAVGFPYPGGTYKGKDDPRYDYNIEMGTATIDHPDKPFTSVDLVAHDREQSLAGYDEVEASSDEDAWSLTDRE
jgi:hypothetical protein